MSANNGQNKEEQLLEKVLDPPVYAAFMSIPRERRPQLNLLRFLVRSSTEFRLNVQTAELIILDSNGKPTKISADELLKKAEAEKLAQAASNNQRTILQAKRTKRSKQPVITPHESLSLNDTPGDTAQPLHMAANPSQQNAVGRPRGRRVKQRKKSPLTIDVESTSRPSGNRRINVSTLSPKRYNTKVRKMKISDVPAVDSNGNPLRRSERCVAQRFTPKDEPPSKKVKYEERAAVIPDLIVNLDACVGKEYDELVLDPELLSQIDEKDMKLYLLAAGAKLGADVHSCAVHLARNNYDIKIAMETIDDENSIARVNVEGKNGPGIWSDKELTSFAHILNSSRLRKSISRMKKNIPTKASSCFVNAYYQLKSYRCVNAKRTLFCPNKAKASKLNLGFEYVKSSDCANCKNELWKQPLEDQLSDVNLCALCYVYKQQYNKMRPNAAVTPEKFNIESTFVCTCKTGAVPEDRTASYVKCLDRCTDRNVLLVQGDLLAKIIKGFNENVTVSPALEKIRNNVDMIEKSKIYILVARPGAVKLAGFVNIRSKPTSHQSLPASLSNSRECSPDRDNGRAMSEPLCDKYTMDNADLEKDLCFLRLMQRFKPNDDTDITSEDIAEVVDAIIESSSVELSADAINRMLQSVGLDLGVEVLQEYIDSGNSDTHSMPALSEPDTDTVSSQKIGEVFATFEPVRASTEPPSGSAIQTNVDRIRHQSEPRVPQTSPFKYAGVDPEIAPLLSPEIPINFDFCENDMDVTEQDENHEITSMSSVQHSNSYDTADGGSIRSVNDIGADHLDCGFMAKLLLDTIFRNQQCGLVSEPLVVLPSETTEPPSVPYEVETEDVIFFGTINPDKTIETDFDSSFKKYYDALMVNRSPEYVEPIYTRKSALAEVKDRPENEIGIFTFLKAYHDSKKKITVASEMLGVSTEYLRAYMVDNQDALVRFNKDFEHSARAGRRRKNAKKAPSEEPMNTDPAILLKYKENYETGFKLLIEELSKESK